MKKSVLLFFLIIVFLLCCILGLVFSLLLKDKHSDDSFLAWSVSDKKDYANVLIAKGLNKEAVLVFENLANDSSVKRSELAQLSYRIGCLYMDCFEYEKALPNFYKAEILDSNANFISDMNQKIVEALENLGMSSQAQYELKSRSAIDERSVNKKDTPVARIGNDFIMQIDIDNAFNKLPEWMRASYKGENMNKFVHEFISTEVLYRKAKRLGLEKKAEVIAAVQDLKKQIVVEQLIKNEISSKINLSEQDVQMFYNANKADFTEPEKMKVSFVSFSDEAEKDNALKTLAEGKAENVDVVITKADSFLPGVGKAKDVLDALFFKQAGQTTDPFKIGDKFYIFNISEKIEGREKSFSEVKDQAEYKYKMQKHQELMQKLLKDAVESQEVEIYALNNNENTNTNENKLKSESGESDK